MTLNIVTSLVTAMVSTTWFLVVAHDVTVIPSVFDVHAETSADPSKYPEGKLNVM